MLIYESTKLEFVFNPVFAKYGNHLSLKLIFQSVLILSESFILNKLGKWSCSSFFLKKKKDILAICLGA